MDKASPFPRLALPFALIGGAAGWLSTTFIAHRLDALAPPMWILFSATALATVFAAIVGAILTRSCQSRRKRYVYELDDPGPETHAPLNNAFFHSALVVAAGAATGVTLTALRGNNIPLEGYAFCTALSMLSAAAFLPIGFAVIAAARRAQRARLGSIVAGSDRRAVWGILAAILPLMAVPSALDWPAATFGSAIDPVVPLGMVAMAGVLVLALLLADARALFRARRALAPGLVSEDPDSHAPIDHAFPTVDLGLGDGRLARVSPSPSAYRGQARTLGVVQGDPGLAEKALRRAVARGVVSLLGALFVCGVHWAARTDDALVMYWGAGCPEGQRFAGRAIADLFKAHNPRRAIAIYEHSCDPSVAVECAAAAKTWERGEGIPVDVAQARVLLDQACNRQHGKLCHLPGAFKESGSRIRSGNTAQ